MLTQEYLKTRVSYCPETGLFHWKASGFKRKEDATRLGGCVCSCTNTAGYVVIRLDGKLYLAHRLAFLYMEGKMPEFVDHDDRVRTNNIWSNLKAATRESNNRNVTASSNTGHVNITWVEKKKHFVVTIKWGSEKKNKTFRTLEDAILWRDQQKEQMSEKSSKSA